MRVAQVLYAKGSVVATVTQDVRVAAVLAVMAEQRVGAVVVIHDGTVVGMVWERDVVRQLHERGVAMIAAPVSEIMNTEVVSCVPGDDVDAVLQTMTERRIRHFPVIIDGDLGGIVSMGDLVKATIDELKTDRAHLQSYIAT
ncbi:MAG: CBS domain-containing protein [Actinomycetota bacterium]|nr:CBS domain-containing protein [Actinomycetota bacterium]